MDDKIRREYLKNRREHPLMPARHALVWAKAKSGKGWEEEGYSGQLWRKELGDGLTAELFVEVESQYPQEDEGLGHYVAEYGVDNNHEWNGNYGEPKEAISFYVAEDTLASNGKRRTITFPYTSYHCASHVQGNDSMPYFIPEGIEDHFNHLRQSVGLSRSVAWDETKRWIEDTISSFFGGPLTYWNVTVSITDKNGFELASESTLTDTIADDEDHFFEISDDMLLEVIDEANKAREERDYGLTPELLNALKTELQLHFAHELDDKQLETALRTGFKRNAKQLQSAK